MIVCIFYQVNLTGIGFLNRPGAEIEAEIAEIINLIKNANKSFFIIEKVQKYRKCPAL